MTIQGITDASPAQWVSVTQNASEITEIAGEISKQSLRDSFARAVATNEITYAPPHEIHALKRLPSLDELLSADFPEHNSDFPSENLTETALSEPNEVIAEADTILSDFSDNDVSSELDAEPSVADEVPQPLKNQDYHIDDSAFEDLFEQSFSRVDNARKQLNEFFDYTDFSNAELEQSELLKMFTDGTELDLTETEAAFSSLSELDWSDSAVAEKLYKMAQTLSAGNSDLLEQLKSAVNDAYTQIEEVFPQNAPLESLNRFNSLFN